MRACACVRACVFVCECVCARARARVYGYFKNDIELKNVDSTISGVPDLQNTAIMTSFSFFCRARIYNKNKTRILNNVKIN